MPYFVVRTQFSRVLIFVISEIKLNIRADATVKDVVDQHESVKMQFTKKMNKQTKEEDVCSIWGFSSRKTVIVIHLVHIYFLYDPALAAMLSRTLRPGDTSMLLVS